MHIQGKAYVRVAMLLTTLSLSRPLTYGQETPPPAAPQPEPGPWTREEGTGDWGGTRSQWKDKGVDLEFKFSQFVQGVSSGGVDTGAVGNSKFQTGFKFDMGKLAGWNFWIVDVKTETRFGGPLLGKTGALNPVNTTAMIPANSGNVFSITGLNVTKLIPVNLNEGDFFAVSLGRYNVLDLSDEHFFGGGGTERFFNIAQIGPLTVLRQVPLITNLTSFAYIKRGEPFITLALIDPNDHSLDPGLSDVFADGVTFAPAINLPSKFFGKSGKHTFGGAITTKAYTPFDAIRQVIIPRPPLNPIEPQRGSWSTSYVGRQYLVERGKNDGWGLFTQIAFADKDTSPLTQFFNVGLGGNGLFAGRRTDEFGIAYAYSDLNEILKDNLDPLSLRRLRPEHQLETFYNFHLTPWLRLTADLQIIRPIRPIATTAIVPGARVELIF